MSKILTGCKAKVFVNGKLIGTFDSIDIIPSSKETEAVCYIGSKLPNHKCRNCGDKWMFSTDDNKCMMCESENIEHTAY